MEGCGTNPPFMYVVPLYLLGTFLILIPSFFLFLINQNEALPLYLNGNREADDGYLRIQRLIPKGRYSFSGKILTDITSHLDLVRGPWSTYLEHHLGEDFVFMDMQVLYASARSKGPSDHMDFDPKLRKNQTRCRNDYLFRVVNIFITLNEVTPYTYVKTSGMGKHWQ